MTIFILSLILYTVLSGKEKTKNCLSHDPCKGYSGHRCAIGDYFQIVVHLEAAGQHRYYPFCIKIDEFAELYLEGSYDWLTTVENVTQNIYAGNPPTMTIVAPRGNDDSNPKQESYSWPVLGIKDGTFTWSRRFTSILNLRYGKFMDRAEDTFTFEDQCSGDEDDRKCKEFSKNDKKYYLCIKGKKKDTCSVVWNSPLQNDLEKKEKWPGEFVPKDVKLFVVFSGSDSKGSAFKSASYLPSKFKMLSFGFTFGNAYEAMFD